MRKIWGFSGILNAGLQALKDQGIGIEFIVEDALE
jgi:hypothetical protein